MNFNKRRSCFSNFSFPSKKIWIDLDNSPHVPFFNPIIGELKKRGYQILITTRDCFQVCELAHRFNIQYKPIGHHHGKYKIIKFLGLLFRAAQLMPTVIKEKPRLALSHGSRAQLIASKILNIPSVVIFDYEYAKTIPFINPTWIIRPEIVPYIAKRRRKVGILKYPGIKEEVYIHNFKPDPNIKKDLGLNGRELVITIRPPATEAHYHNSQSKKLFESVIDFFVSKPNNKLVILPRNYKQKKFIKKKWGAWEASGKIIIPDHIIDGLSLIWYSDLVISGGGTMNREAAALEVPVYSIFQGKIGAIDLHLSDTGRLTLIKNVDDVHNKIVLMNRYRPTKPNYSNSESLEKLINKLVWIIEK